MEKKDYEVDEQLKKYASLQTLVLPDGYVELVSEKIDHCMERRQKMKGKIPKAAVAALVLVVLLGGTIGVYAAKNYFVERMGKLSQEEKEEYVSEVLHSKANADVYSRSFSEKEKSRIQELEQQYLNKGLFPEQSLIRISSEEEIDPEQICFWAESSTFYFPERDLTDEELLEFIDFYYTRDYSLDEDSSQTQSKFEVKSEMEWQEAVELAKEKVQSVFGLDMQNVTISQEYNQGNDGEAGFSTLYVSIITEDGVTYMASVDLQSRKMDTLSIETGDSHYSSGIAVDVDSYYAHEQEAEKLAQKWNPEADYNMTEIEYISTNKQELDTGVINYYFRAEDGNICVVSYSCVTNEFYSIRNFTSEEIEARSEQKEIECEKKSTVRNVIDIF